MTDAEVIAALEAKVAELRARLDAAEKKAPEIPPDLRARLDSLLASFSH